MSNLLPSVEEGKFRTHVLLKEYSDFSEFISGFNGAILLVVGNVPVDSETPTVIS
jgi:hypothetical protein